MRHVFVWWVLLEALGLLALPLTFRIFSRAHAHGYPFSKILAILLISAASWLLGFGLLPLSAALPVAIGALAAVAAWRAWVDRADLAAWLRDGGAASLLRHDAVWTAGFLFFAWQRALAPDIFGAEKYMDFAFLNVLTRTESFPPQDPWMAGQSFSYYYFGYLCFANLVRLSGIPTYVAYNLCVATAAGLAFGEFAALGLRLTRSFLFGILSGASALLLGNLDGLLQFIERGRLTPIDYWRSSRVVGGGDTINEFPFFSTIHGDLHPHFQVLPVTGLLLALLLDRTLFPPGDEPRIEARRIGGLALVTFAFACMVSFSPWELPVGALLIALLLNRHLPLLPLLSKARLLLVGEVGCVVVASYLPFKLGFAAPSSGGVGVQLAQTDIGEFLTVFAHLLFPLAVLVAVEGRTMLQAARQWRDFLVAALVLLLMIAALAGNAVLPLLGVLIVAMIALHAQRTDDDWRAPVNLALVALAALLACEVVFLRDSYGLQLYRMNTVFKLYFQAWLLLSLAAPWALWNLWSRTWTWQPARPALAASAAALALAACAYPVGLTATRMGSPWPRTLDGTAYLARDHADDFGAIAWLRENVDGLPVILETTGDPYSYYARFSSNTGLPTVMGWTNHEGLWRAHDPAVEKARREVLQIYNAASLDLVQPLLQSYRVRYIAVGELERKDHPPEALQKFAALPIVFQRGNTVIYEWRG